MLKKCGYKKVVGYWGFEMTLEKYCEQFYEGWYTEEDKEEFVRLMYMLIDEEELTILDTLH